MLYLYLSEDQLYIWNCQQSRTTICVKTKWWVYCSVVNIYLKFIILFISFYSKIIQFPKFQVLALGLLAVLHVRRTTRCDTHLPQLPLSHWSPQGIFRLIKSRHLGWSVIFSLFLRSFAIYVTQRKLSPSAFIAACCVYVVKMGMAKISNSWVSSTSKMIFLGKCSHVFS